MGNTDLGDGAMDSADCEKVEHSILFAAHPTVGHTNALRAIGAQLRAQGHSTGFALVKTRVPFVSFWPEPVRAAAKLPQVILGEGSTILELTPTFSALWHAARLPRATGQSELEIALQLFTSGLKTQAIEIYEHAKRSAASVVVGDYLMPAALLGAKLARLPFVALYHSALPFPAEGAPPFGTTLPVTAMGSQEWIDAENRLERMCLEFDNRIEKVTRELKLPSLGKNLLQRPISPDLNIMATAPVLEPGLRPLVGNVVMTGPCLASKPSIDDEGQSVLASLPKNTRIIYISLGTVFNHQPLVYRLLIEGALKTGAHVIVSAGASFSSLMDLKSDRVLLFQRVPQVPLLERIDCMISHGGNNSVQECLSAGRPMLLIPFGGDQQANARRVERLGVGETLSKDALNSTRIHEALLRLSSDSVVKRASELSMALSKLGGVKAAADAVMAMA